MSNLFVISTTPEWATAEQLFRAACGTYQIVLAELNRAIGAGEVTRDNAREAVDRLRNAEKGAFEALDKLVDGHPHAKAIKTYQSTATVFAKSWAVCLNHQIDPLSPKYRRRMKDLFRAWKSAEQAYVRAGYCSIPFEEWLAPFLDDGIMAVSTVGSMMVARGKDEKPVMHAVALMKKHRKLRI